MESTNFHHQHQLQDQIARSSALATPSCNGVQSPYSWTTNTILNTGNFIPNIAGEIINSRDLRNHNEIPVSSFNSCMIQGLGFHQASSAGGFTGHPVDNLNLQRLKEELPDSTPKFTEMMNSPSSSIEDLHLNPTNYTRNDQRDLNDMSERLLLGTLSSGCQISGLHLPPGETPSRGIFSQILPTINISNFNQPSSAIPSSMDMNLQALDLFNSARFSGSFSQPSDNNLGFFKQNLSYGLEHMQQSIQRPLNRPTKISPFTNGVAETKRSSSVVEPKVPQAAPKKPRLETRISSPPFKVRKEKLGDRISALQQLVAPFGKTDTASVLMEAIGYIKFLQNQVETLSVPYMKSSCNKTSRTMQGGFAKDGNEESRQDLRSRGLCLVPVSCLSYVTDGGGALWPPPNFG